MNTLASIEEIRRFLPHRYPFLLVDRVTEVDREKNRIRGYKNITVNEPQFTGHFPDLAIFPGVLIMEAMAQLGAYYLLTAPGRKRNLALFAGIDKARFKRVVVPGDRLEMEVHLIRDRGIFAKMRGVATVDGKVVAEAELMSAQPPSHDNENK